MKFVKKAKYEYTENGINEANSFIKWCDKKEIYRKINSYRFYPYAVMFVMLYLLSKSTYSDPLKALFEGDLPHKILNIILLALAIIALSLVVLFIFRALIRFIPLSKGKLDCKCVFSLKPNDWAIYNGEISRGQALLSLSLPLIIFVILFSIIAVFTSGIIKYFFLLMIPVSTCICGNDIIMFIICLKKLKKDDIIFGEYIKI